MPKIVFRNYSRYRRSSCKLNCSDTLRQYRLAQAPRFFYSYAPHPVNSAIAMVKATKDPNLCLWIFPESSIVILTVEKNFSFFGRASVVEYFLQVSFTFIMKNISRKTFRWELREYISLKDTLRPFFKLALEKQDQNVKPDSSWWKPFLLTPQGLKLSAHCIIFFPNSRKFSALQKKHMDYS